MPVYKDNNHPGQWRVVYRYTDWTGERKQTQKRGFKTKREAAEWEREQLRQKNADLDMTFESFAGLYEADMKPRLKANTWRTKETILKKKLIPYFGKRRMCDITSHDILTWQNQMMEYRDENGEGYSPVYLKTLHNQLSAIFNHAVRFYNLSKSPVSGVKNMGKKSNGEMLFWTNEEYEKFANAMMDKPRSYYAFELLYWCGIREGELLALTPADFDFEKGTMRINKSYQRIAKQDMITTPKTEKSNRTITLPDTVANEIKDYLKTLYKPDDDERIFPFTKDYLLHEMKRGCKETGVKRIRIHDLRHSHVALLIHMGYSIPAIAQRLGHEGTEITFKYAHLFPSAQSDIAVDLNGQHPANNRKEAV